LGKSLWGSYYYKGKWDCLGKDAPAKEGRGVSGIRPLFRKRFASKISSLSEEGGGSVSFRDAKSQGHLGGEMVLLYPKNESLKTRRRGKTGAAPGGGEKPGNRSEGFNYRGNNPG